MSSSPRVHTDPRACAGHRTADFDYELPPELIAQAPLAERDASRLLVLERRSGRIRHHIFRDLPQILDSGDLLVANRSAVFPARLLGQRAGGSAVELLLLRADTEPGKWQALVRPGRRLRRGATVDVGGATIHIESEAKEPDGRRTIRIEARGETAEALIERVGRTPLPPYIRRADTTHDRSRYQTVYAREPGSVAAPTAGLHFTEALRRELREHGIGWAEIVLHVGPATFRPIKVADVTQHRLEPEPFLVPETTALALRETRTALGRVVAVGTTVVRTLESAALGPGQLKPGAGTAELLIAPGHTFQAVDALVTNFHLPRSSLLVLAAAFAGRDAILEAYREAVARRYRFYSYGDAMLIV